MQTKKARSVAGKPGVLTLAELGRFALPADPIETGVVVFDPEQTKANEAAKPEEWAAGAAAFRADIAKAASAYLETAISQLPEGERDRAREACRPLARVPAGPYPEDDGHVAKGAAREKADAALAELAPEDRKLRDTVLTAIRQAVQRAVRERAGRPAHLVWFADFRFRA